MIAALNSQSSALLSFGIYAFIILVVSLVLGFWIWTLSDCLKHEIPGSKEKIFWAILIVVLCPFIGAFMYQVGRRQKRIRELGE
jgi:uncharacterized membrane protein